MSLTPFLYSECFTSKALDRIPDRLKIKGSGDPELLLIVRLLSGAINVEHINSSRAFKQRENYFSSDFKRFSSNNWGKKFPLLIGENYTSDNLAEYIENTKLKHKTFYKNILSELSYFFY